LLPWAVGGDPAEPIGDFAAVAVRASFLPPIKADHPPRRSDGRESFQPLRFRLSVLVSLVIALRLVVSASAQDRPKIEIVPVIPHSGTVKSVAFSRDGTHILSGSVGRTLKLWDDRHTTAPEHMPSSHRRYATWTPQRMVNEAAKIGPATIALVEAIMKAKPHPEQGFRSCLGIMRLVRTYGIARVEAASRRGNDIGATTCGSIPRVSTSPISVSFGIG
jgi:hypothetical protein